MTSLHFCGTIKDVKRVPQIFFPHWHTSAFYRKNVGFVIQLRDLSFPGVSLMFAKGLLDKAYL